jgi:hypothetical protein
MAKIEWKANFTQNNDVYMFLSKIYLTKVGKYSIMSLFFKKAALSLDHLLEPGPEQLACPYNVVL